MKKAAFTLDTQRNYDVKPVGDQDFEITGELATHWTGNTQTTSWS